MHTTNLNFHTFTSHPFILAKRSIFILALHQFSIQFSSTTSPPHSPTSIPHKRPNSPLFPSTLQNPQNTPFPSPSNSTIPHPSSLSPFQHPFNNHHPSASNHKTSHLTNTSTLPQTHHTLPLPFANPSLTHPKRKENTTHALSSQHFTTPLNSKESTAMHLYNLTIHKPSVVQRSIYGWCRLG